MKKILVMALAAVLLVGLCACGNNAEPAQESAAAMEAPAAETAAAEEAATEEQDGDAAAMEALVGRWQETDDYRDYISQGSSVRSSSRFMLKFNADGTGEDTLGTGEPSYFTYEYNNGVVTLAYEDAGYGAYEAEYELLEDKLFYPEANIVAYEKIG